MKAGQLWETIGSADCRHGPKSPTAPGTAARHGAEQGLPQLR